MKSIGETLRAVREERGYTVDQVARDTHITKKFILALEEEAFETFPGESYLVGFLRNYANYLGLDEQELVALYHNMKIQEEPAPLTELLDTRRFSFNPKIAGIIAGALIVVAAIVLLVLQGPAIPTDQTGQNSAVQTQTTDQTGPDETAGDLATVELTSDFLEQRFEMNTRVLVKLPDLTGSIDILGFDETQVALRVNGRTLTMKTVDAALVDIDQNEGPDLRLQTRGVNRGSGGSLGIVIRIDRSSQLPATVQSAADQTSTARQTVSAPLPTNLGTTVIQARTRQPQVLLEAARRQNFTVQLIFTAPSMFRYLDDRGQGAEQYIAAGQSLTLTAASWIRFWIANGGAVQMTVAGVPVRAGANGEVSTFLIGWENLPASQTQRLELKPVY